MREYKNTRNPILPPDIHIPDGEGHVMTDGRLYIYGSYDETANEYCSDRYYVVSTADMEKWVIHDEAFTAEAVTWIHDGNAPKYPGIDREHPTPFMKKILEEAAGSNDIQEEGDETADEEAVFLYAPDCIYKDGRYYLYFCTSDDREGVAVSECPQGPFTNPVQLPCGGIDPAVFIDDDGKAYYYWGQLFSHGVRLNEDMISFDPDNIVDNLVTEEKHFFHEGSSMRKMNDTYYYVYADMQRGRPTALGYATGSSPLGPFEYRGIIIDNAGCDPESWNNHGSIECVNGQWYVFYHRSSRGCRQYRRLCIEPIFINPDGTIDEVKMTSQGPGKPFGPGEKIMGYQACGLKGSVYIGAEENRGAAYEEKLTHICHGDEAIFRYVHSQVELRSIRILASGSGQIEVLMNGHSAGTVKITDGVQINRDINMPAGEYELVLRFMETEGLEIREIVIN